MKAKINYNLLLPLVIVLAITLFSCKSSFTAAGTPIDYSQDYKVEKLENETIGEYQISRLLVVSDFVSNAEVNKFIADFSSALKIEFEKYELNFISIRSGTSDVENIESIWEFFNPDGILKVTPKQTFIKSIGWASKHGLIFVLGLSYRQNGEKEYIPLFTTKIEVVINKRLEKSGELAAKDFFNLLVEGKYLTLIK